MYLGKTLFAQLMDFVPWTSFRRIVARYGGDARVRTLNSMQRSIGISRDMPADVYLQIGVRSHTARA